MTKSIFKVLKEVLEDKELTTFDKNVFSALITFNGRDNIFPDRRTIAKRINSSEKNLPTISKATKKLKERGYIEIIHRKQTSNIYKLVLNDPGTKINYTINESVKSVTLTKLKEYSINESYLDTILKINTGAGEVYQKCFMLLYCIGSLEKRKDEINNFQSYLLTTYKNLTYTQYHKQVFESKKSIRKKIKPDINIITNPEINY